MSTSLLSEPHRWGIRNLPGDASVIAWKHEQTDDSNCYRREFYAIKGVGSLEEFLVEKWGSRFANRVLSLTLTYEYQGKLAQ
jgi:hypothetical protein